MKSLLSVGEKLCTLLAIVSGLYYIGLFSAYLPDTYRMASVFAPVIILLLLGALYGLREAKAKSHKRKLPYPIFGVFAVFLLFALFLSPSQTFVVVWSVFLLVISLWNFSLEQKFSKKKVVRIKV